MRWRRRGPTGSELRCVPGLGRRPRSAPCDRAAVGGRGARGRRATCARGRQRQRCNRTGRRIVRAGSDRAQHRRDAGCRPLCCAPRVCGARHTEPGGALLTSAPSHSAPPLGTPPRSAARRSAPDCGRPVDLQPGLVSRSRHHGRRRRSGRCTRRCHGCGRSRLVGGRRGRRRSNCGRRGGRWGRHGHRGRRRNGRRARDGRRIDRRRRTTRRQQGQWIQIRLRLRRQAHAEMHVGLRDLAVAARADRADGAAFGDGRAPDHADRAEMRERDRVPLGRLDGDAFPRRRHHAGKAHRSRRGCEHR